MATKYKTIITSAGAARLAAAMSSSGKKVDITHMAIGDGGGALPQPVPGQTKLVREVYRAQLNKIVRDDRNDKYVVAELVIPPETGGFWMRESGLYDSEGTLIAVANMAESYKPLLAEGSGRSQTIRMVLIVSDVTAVNLTIDSTTVMATNDYVDSALAAHEKSRNHPDGTLTAKGFVQLSSATNSTSETLAATPKAVKAVMDETNKKAPKNSPALTGTPTTPTPPKASRDTTIANTEFVQAALDPAIMWRGMLPVAAHLNNYGPTPDFIGQWARSTNTNTNASYGFPEDNGQGVFEVMPGGLYGCTHRYTARNGNIYARSLAAAWNGTDGPWGEWQPVGKKPLNDLGIGLSAITTLATFDWQQIDAPSGAIFRVAADNITNMPDGIAFASGTGVFIKIDGSSANGARFSAEVIPDTAVDTNYRIFKVLVVGGKGARTFGVRQVFTNTDVVPLANGGLGATTPEGGRAALGFAEMSIGLSNMTALATLDWQQFDFVTGAKYLISSSSWTNVPDGISYDPSTQIFVSVDGITSSGTVIELTLIPNTSGDANYRMYKVRIGSSKGSRIFRVRRIFTNTDTIPVENGGTGSTTAAGAVDKLGLRDTVNKAAGAVQRVGDTMAGELKTTSPNAVRIKNGGRGLILHFNGTQFHFLLTNANDADGVYNNLRPLYIDAATGVVTLASESNCTGNFRAAAMISTNNIFAGNAQFGTNADCYGTMWGGWLSTWLNSQFGVRDNNINARATYDWVTNGFLPRVQSQDTIGTFIWAYFNGGNVNLNDVVSGGNLSPATGDGLPVGWYLPGSWRCAGISRTTNDAHRTTLWQRVA